MPFLLGMLGVLQICFLPGAILHRLYIGSSTKSEFCYSSFALSLIVNWCLVFLLTSLGIYTQSALFVILFLEFTLVYYLIFVKDSSSEIKNDREQDFKFLESKLNWDSIIHYLFAFLLLLSFIDVIPYIGKIFTRWHSLAQPCILGGPLIQVVEPNHNAYRPRCLLCAPTEPLSRSHSMYLH